MPIRPPEYDSIALELKPSLENLPPLIIAISGSLHAGKTTLARFLAWYFNISLIETDFYLVPNKDFTYDSPEIERMISFRLGMPRPVIVEGFKVLSVLAEIKKTPDIIIRVQNKSNIITSEVDEDSPACWGFSQATYYNVEVSH